MADSRGHLNPGADGVWFDRFELGDWAADLVRHVWVVRWSLPDNAVSRQRVLGYPAYNAIVLADQAYLAGPDPRLFVRPLTGSGWTVGVLFRPSAGTLLTATAPSDLVAGTEPLPDAPRAAIARVLGSPVPPATVLPSAGREGLEAILTEWLRPIAARVDDSGRAINEASRVAEQDESLLRAADLAARLGVSSRSLERLTRARIGMAPKWLIECRRLQAAATTLHAHPETELSRLAADLGYADYAHFSRAYKKILGQTPDAARRTQ